ncbi:phenylalanine--tRNA ligase subunit beta [Patescibacteria group bacterium]|nr:phenylalanine--tRNA ligase subunit beta [Patescibacteria group bacterium]
MKVSLDWLSDFVAIPKDSNNLAKELTLKTCEVEDVICEKDQFDGILVGEVLEKNKHPNADRLSVATVNYGEGKETVVCGAPNLKEGQLVVFATSGTVLPNGLELKEIDIRGVTSKGMICAEDEVGLSENHDEIIVLDPDKATVGMAFAEYLEKDDVVFEIDNKSITHRPDLFSHIGIAREIAAITDTEFNEPDYNNVTSKGDDALKIVIENPDECSRYMGLVLSNVQNTKSPGFIQKRLSACGMRPINSIVDIANYVMLETGQPLHTFDYDTVADGKKGKEVHVRYAKKGETLETIDGETRELKERDLVIADTQKPIALAGVMGGANTEVSEDTHKIILESAHFNGPTVRRTSWRLGLRSESVTRFEKGLPRVLPEKGLKRAVELLMEYAGATIESEVADEYPNHYKETTISLDQTYPSQLLGISLSDEMVKNSLSKLGFGTEKEGENSVVTVPWFREGMTLAEEVVEEVGRMYGPDKIQPVVFDIESKPTTKDPLLAISSEIKPLLAGLGLDELSTYSFYGDKEIQNCHLNVKDHLKIANPFSKDCQYMRISLLPNLLSKLSLNLPYFETPRYFEIGHVYSFDYEVHYVAGLIFGAKKSIFFEAKGMLETVLSRLNVPYNTKKELRGPDSGMLEDNQTLMYEYDGEPVARLSVVKSDVVKRFKVKKGFVATFTVHLENLLDARDEKSEYVALPKYPDAKLDLAFVIKQDVPVQEVINAIFEVSGAFLKNVSIFDIYRGKPLTEDEKSVAFHLTYRSNKRTLTDKEVEEVRKNTEKKLMVEFGARLRDF